MTRWPARDLSPLAAIAVEVVARHSDDEGLTPDDAFYADLAATFGVPADRAREVFEATFGPPGEAP